MERKMINPWKWQDPLGFVQANEVSHFQRTILCAGQTSVNAEGKPMHTGNMHAQIHFALDNLEMVLGQAGTNLSHVVRLNFYTTDIDSFFEANAAMVKRLTDAGCRPAMTLLGVTRLAFPPLLVEIEATAVI